MEIIVQTSVFEIVVGALLAAPCLITLQPGRGKQRPYDSSTNVQTPAWPPKPRSREWLRRLPPPPRFRENGVPGLRAPPPPSSLKRALCLSRLLLVSASPII